jgi:hypothetical protein
MLFYRTPGASGYTSRSMAHGTGTAYSTVLSVSNDGLTNEGTLTYYVVAKDSSPAGVSSRTPAGTKSLSIKACNFPPTYSDSANGYPLYVAVTGSSCAPGTPTTINIKIFVIDQDDAVASVIFWYRPYGSTSWYALALTAVVGTDTWQGTLSNTKFPTLPDQGHYDATWFVKMTDAGGASSRSSNMTLTEEGCVNLV